MNEYTHIPRRNEPEGGEALGDHVTVNAPNVFVDPEALYYSGKSTTGSYLDNLGLLDRTYGTSLRDNAERHLKNSRDYSGLPVAQWFESLSRTIWNTNGMWSMFSLSQKDGQIPIQKTCNNHLWTHNKEGDLNHITSDDITPLFPEGRSQEWPNIILTSNHARAWRGDDLTQLMQGIERMASDGWGKPLAAHPIVKGQSLSDVKGKNAVVLACHTEQDIYMNGAQLIRRRIALMEDKARQDPANRTLENISPAAVRLAKLILKTMMSRESINGVDLDREKQENTPAHFKKPFVADDERYQNFDFVLRSDASRIAQHLKLVGYSRGANTVTDALRFFYQECKALGPRLKTRDLNGNLRAVNDGDIQGIISNIGLLSLAPGEVPLTKAERETVGIRRTTIYNTHDLTAGHLINPDAADYDRWSDKLICIEGTRDDAGHNIVEALGDSKREGYLMKPENAQKSQAFADAQDEIKAFFASNFGKHAITELCLYHNAEAKSPRNEFYLQFAPGISRADSNKLEAELLDELRAHGFPSARAYSDLTHRRRVQIILDEQLSPTQPLPSIHDNALAIENCKKALAALNVREHGALFVTGSALRYLDEEMAKATPKSLVSEAEGASRPVASLAK